MSRPFGKYAPADVAKFATAVEQRWALIVSVIPRVYLRRRRTEADLGHHCWLPAGGSWHSSKQSGAAQPVRFGIVAGRTKVAD